MGSTRSYSKLPQPVEIKKIANRIVTFIAFSIVGTPPVREWRSFRSSTYELFLLRQVCTLAAEDDDAPADSNDSPAGSGTVHTRECWSRIAAVVDSNAVDGTIRNAGSVRRCERCWQHALKIDVTCLRSRSRASRAFGRLL